MYTPLLANIAILVLSGFVGFAVISKVPNTLHTPLMSGSNFIHGIVVIGGLIGLLDAASVAEQAAGFVAVLLGAGNAAGGYAVTGRMLAMFQTSAPEPKRRKAHHSATRKPEKV